MTEWAKRVFGAVWLRAFVAGILLVVLVTPSVIGSNLALAQQFAPPVACDTLAAHPADNFRFAAGVSDADLDVEAAKEACMQAVSQFSKSGRIHFQLGRIFYKMGNREQATLALKTALKLGYGQAGAYLAALYESSDDQTTKSQVAGLRETANALGFKYVVPVRPERVVAIEESEGQEEPSSMLSGGFTKRAGHAVTVDRLAVARAKYFRDETATQVDTVEFSASDFDQSTVLNNLFFGRFADINRRDIGLLHYFKFFNEMMSTKGVGAATPACLQLYQTGLGGILANAAMDAVGLGGSYEQTSRQGWQLLGNMLQGIQKRGLRTFTDGAARKQAMINAGSKDAVLLVQRYGCAHAATRIIYENMARFLRGNSPRFLPGVIKQKQQAQMQDATLRACNRAYDGKSFCGCAVNFLKRQPLNETAWKEMTADFNALVNIAPALPSLRGKLSSCG